LNALRAFEAAARHLSLTKAASELHVTPAALSHQIRGLEEQLQLKLFERKTRAIELTEAGHQLYPGLHAAFTQMRLAIASLERVNNDRVLVVSAPPGFTAKWLAPRLYRFMQGNPNIDARISSSMALANFTTDGVDVAIRHMRDVGTLDPELVYEKLYDVMLVPVCSPRLIAESGLSEPDDIRGVTLIHDDSLAPKAELPRWADWLTRAGVDGIDVSRGLRFSSADHALDATVEGAGILLAHEVLAYDDLRTGRLVAPFDLKLDTGRGIFFVCPKGSEARAKIRAFREWIGEEARRTDLTKLQLGAPSRGKARR
jgi:LysR family glycine cleavage system transcriptional activator